MVWRASASVAGGARRRRYRERSRWRAGGAEPARAESVAASAAASEAASVVALWRWWGFAPAARRLMALEWS